MKTIQPPFHGHSRICLLLAAMMLAQAAQAGPLLDKLRERRAHASAPAAELDEDMDGADTGTAAAVPAGVRVMRNVAYGSNPLQRMDIYLPQQAGAAPVIFMVHGGAWRTGDKAASTVVQNKVARWVPEGFIVISANYRLLPDADPLTQARDVATALAAAQAKAASWGGDPARFILMGHSAGAHLVGLLNAAPQLAYQAGAKPWLGTVSLDSAAIDVVSIMNRRHFPLYDPAFGTDPAYWQSVSPYHVLVRGAAPMLAVCSSRRSDACPPAERFVARAATLGVTASVLPQALTHKEINQQLGLPGAYTAAVEAFMAQLDPAVSQRLAGKAGER
ncbi:Carboxylesterase [Andreprevotia sp. IGB-42]|uniref:alpha/beta hydrolase n=1 Tax=Andreprevotia sp. IGB-42 TaxID=2497473 RepID=UPI00135B0BB2|nr:alpha/beta hydrolase [Andreprevotia sp. IGB-42]KAF0815218.1 Carboxylesterase [Andreprevotia sp. IGB-42]